MIFVRLFLLTEASDEPEIKEKKIKNKIKLILNLKKQ